MRAKYLKKTVRKQRVKGEQGNEVIDKKSYLIILIIKQKAN
jgi:hypothetical protein